MEANKITQNVNKSIFFPFLAPLYAKRTSAAIAAVLATAEATVQPLAAAPTLHSKYLFCYFARLVYIEVAFCLLSDCQLKRLSI